jgi:hypothetical protein
VIPLTPPTPAEGPVIDPSSTAVPEVPRPTAPVRPSTSTRAAALNRTRKIVGGASLAAFAAILAAVGLHPRAEPASTVRPAGNEGSSSSGSSNPGSSDSVDPGLVRPYSGRGSGAVTSPFSPGFPGVSPATPGAAGTAPNTRSRGS